MGHPVVCWLIKGVCENFHTGFGQKHMRLMLTSHVKWSQMVRNPIRPDENAKHKKFEACDAGEISSPSAATAAATALPVATQKKSKNEIREQMQNISIFLQGEISGW